MKETSTVYDVAERAGVSTATVSRVFSNSATVRAQTRERVLNAAREMGYISNSNARRLASRRHGKSSAFGVLGLCFPDHGDPNMEGNLIDAKTGEIELALYSDEVIRGMVRASREHGYALLIASPLAGGPEGLVAKVAGHVDGFAVLAGTVPTEDLKVISRRLPVVVLAGPRAETDHLDYVHVAITEGELELTRHLIVDHGHTSLAFIGGPAEFPDGEARFRGYQQALREASLPVPVQPDLRGDLTRAAGQAAISQLLARGTPLPRALVFANDEMAIGALQTLNSTGRHVPHDVAVVGFDGLPLSRLVQPSLTTVRQPIGRLGQEAVDLLTKRLTDRERKPVSVVLPVSVARRESCGCVAG
ncbi:LacI family DNA-binding transcriptional regulator [Streptomyces sp. NPDC020965]|uniref:LacI family DNA-binding transcriptional regulator n=1 Tax=Streptomyces sp. NPDC020965 TaxID=3365105 RepID=UPI0037B53ABA